MLCLLAGKYSNLPSFCSVASTAPRSSAGAFPARDAAQDCLDIPLPFAWQTSDSFWERCAACVARGWWPTSKGLLQGVLLLRSKSLDHFWRKQNELYSRESPDADFAGSITLPALSGDPAPDHCCRRRQ